MENFKVLFSKDEIQKRIKEVAEEIDKDYEGKEVILVCILKGAVFFTVDLMKNMKSETNLEFMRVSSYSGTQSTKDVILKIDITADIEGKDVLIVEDIVDTGYTLEFLKNYLSKKNPKSLKIATLVDKKGRREVEIEADYVGFTIPNKYVTGYGFDIDEKYRNLPYIGYVEN